MAYAVEITKRAAADLEAMYFWIHAEESRAATDWFNGLEVAISSLDTLPRRTSTIQANRSVRCLLYGRKPHVYRILYSINESKQLVYVLHIRHGARRPLSHGHPKGIE